MHVTALQITALPPGLRRFTLADLPRERWRNGAGWTRTVASAPHVDDAGQPDWRVSLAEISQGAPFSQFPGMDRSAVLVRGGPVCLRGGASQGDALHHWPLSAPGDMACFAGEWPMDNASPEREALIWNVMSRRGQVHAEVTVGPSVASSAAASADEVIALSDRGHTLVWVLQGRFSVLTSDGHELVALDADEGLHSQGRHGALRLVPDTAQARLVHTHLR